MVRTTRKIRATSSPAARTVAPDFDLQPTLVGPGICLRPLQAGDFDELYAVASDPLIWEQNPHPDRWQRKVFEDLFRSGLQSGGALVITDKLSGRIIGSSRYYDWDRKKREVAIGYTFLARAHWGGMTNREVKHLMLNHAFRYVHTVWFHVGKHNWRSRYAMEKIGGVHSHEAVREHNGVPYDYVYFKICAPVLH